MPLKKTIDELTLMDDYMFAQVMRDTDNLKPLLEYILGFKIFKIQLIETQSSIKEGYDSKGIRLDLYVEDENHNIYNVDVQTTDKKNLPKRMRYYQSLLDVSILSPGVNYRNLKKSYIIFICNYDEFAHDRCIYSFENMCHEVPGLAFEDGTYKIVVNTKGSMETVGIELKEALLYLNDQIVSGEYSKQLDEAVNAIKSSEERRLEYMNWAIKEMELLEEAREEAREEGFAQGIEEGIEQGIEQGIERGIEQGIEQGIERGIEQGIERGIEQGIEQGQFRTLKTLAEKKLITIEQAAAEAGMSTDEFLEKMRIG